MPFSPTPTKMFFPFISVIHFYKYHNNYIIISISVNVTWWLHNIHFHLHILANLNCYIVVGIIIFCIIFSCLEVTISYQYFTSHWFAQKVCRTVIIIYKLTIPNFTTTYSDYSKTTFFSFNHAGLLCFKIALDCFFVEFLR